MRLTSPVASSSTRFAYESALSSASAVVKSAYKPILSVTEIQNVSYKAERVG